MHSAAEALGGLLRRRGTSFEEPATPMDDRNAHGSAEAHREPRPSDGSTAPSNEPRSELPPELRGFELPPHKSWAAFHKNPRRTFFNRFADPVAETTFLRFKNRSHRIELLGFMAVYALLVCTTNIPPRHVLPLEAAHILSFVLWLAARFCPWIACGRLSRRPSRSGGTTTDASARDDEIIVDEARARLLEACSVVQAMASSYLLAHLNGILAWRCVHIHHMTGSRLVSTSPIPFSALDFCTRRITFTAAYPWANLTRTNTAVSVLIVLFFIAAQACCNIASPDISTSLAITHAVVSFVIGSALTGLFVALEDRERRLFLSVVGARREDLAVRFRSVAATAAAVAPPFAAAQLHAATTPGEALAAPPVAARMAVVGVADVADFGHFATGLLPSVVVQVLHHLFVAYDEGARRFGVDRAGSFADCYVVVAGLGGDGNSDTAAEAARRVSNFALWQVRAGSPAASWDVFGFDAVSIDSRSAVCTGPAVGGVAGAAGSLRFVLHGPAFDAARSLVERCARGECAIDVTTAQSRGSLEGAAAEGYLVIADASSDSAATPLSSVTSASSPAATVAVGHSRRHSVSAEYHASGFSESGGPALEDDPLRAVTAARAATLLQPAVQRVTMRPWTFEFADAAVERRARNFVRREEAPLVRASSITVVSTYALCLAITAADYIIVEPTLHVTSMACFVAAVLVEGSRRFHRPGSRGRVPLSFAGVVTAPVRFFVNRSHELCAFFSYPLRELGFAQDPRPAGSSALPRQRTPRRPAIAMVLFMLGMVLLPNGATLSNSYIWPVFVMLSNVHLFPSTARWYVVDAVRVVTLLLLLNSMLIRSRMHRHIAGETLLMTYAVLFLSPWTFYAVRQRTRLHFQACEYLGELRATATAQILSQERLARMLLPPHTTPGLQVRWAQRCPNLRNDTYDAAAAETRPGSSSTTQEEEEAARLLSHSHMPDVAEALRPTSVRISARGLGDSRFGESYASTLPSEPPDMSLVRSSLGSTPSIDAAHISSTSASDDTAACLIWSWADSVVGHLRLVPAAAHRGQPVQEYAASVQRWALVLEELSAAAGEDQLLEAVEAIGDDLVFAGPFPRSEQEADKDVLTERAVLSAHAAVIFCRRVATLLDPASTGRSPSVPAAHMVAALGAGPTQSALMGVEGLSFRLLGLARREASALLDAALVMAPRARSSVVVASPAFRRTYNTHGADVVDTPLPAAPPQYWTAVADALKCRDAAASHAIYMSLLPPSAAAFNAAAAAAAAPPMTRLSIFTQPLRWRVRGLGVVMASLVRDLVQ